MINCKNETYNYQKDYLRNINTKKQKKKYKI